MSTCNACAGVGLVSTGANPLNLNEGSKVTCSTCQGTGSVADSVEEAPKVEAPAPVEATGADSVEPLLVEPKVGDPCLTDLEQAGTLDKDENGNWVCKVS